MDFFSKPELLRYTRCFVSDIATYYVAIQKEKKNLKSFVYREYLSGREMTTVVDQIKAKFLEHKIMINLYRINRNTYTDESFKKKAMERTIELSAKLIYDTFPHFWIVESTKTKDSYLLVFPIKADIKEFNPGQYIAYILNIRDIINNILEYNTEIPAPWLSSHIFDFVGTYVRMFKDKSKVIKSDKF